MVTDTSGQAEMSAEDTDKTTPRLPKEWLPSKPYITNSDLEQIQTADPTNLEEWTPVFTTALDGWKFTLMPSTEGERFQFVAFRTPAKSRNWRLWILQPSAPHDSRLMTRLTLAGEEIPVVGNATGPAAANSLLEARELASQWADQWRSGSGRS